MLVAIGASAANFRIGADALNDGLAQVVNTSNEKLMQFGGASINLFGSYSLIGRSAVLALGGNLNTTTTTFTITPSTGAALRSTSDAWLLATTWSNSARVTPTTLAISSAFVRSLTKTFLRLVPALSAPRPISMSVAESAADWSAVRPRSVASFELPQLNVIPAPPWP